MPTCTQCNALLPMDYLTIGICKDCLDGYANMDYDDSLDLLAYTFLGDSDDN